MQTGLFLRILIFIGVFGFTTNALDAQNVSFSHVGIEEGLSEVTGHCIHQDHLNRLWFGTRNGLNCWDGNHMKVFFPERGDSTTIMEHRVGEIEQTGNFLWCKTSKGVSRLNLSTMKFKRFYLSTTKSIEVIENKLTVNTSKGVFQYNQVSDKFERVWDIADQYLPFSQIYQDNKGRIWLTTAKDGLLILYDKNKIQAIEMPKNKGSKVNKLFLFSANELWIATRYDGILRYNIETGEFSGISYRTEPFYIPSNSVRDIVADKNGNIWVGTFKGLAYFNVKTNQTQLIIKDEANECGLSHNSIRSLYVTDDNQIWIGTYFGGYNSFTIDKNLYTVYSNSKNGKGPSYPVIGSMLEDEEGNIWIGTEGGGLDYYNRETGEFKNFPATNNKYGLSQTNVNVIHQIDDNRLLICTYQGGLDILDIEKQEFKHIKPEAFPMAIDHIYSVVPYKGDFLLATRRGVLRFDVDNLDVSHFFDSEDYREQTNVTITRLYIDSKGVLWIGTEDDGLFSFKLDSSELKQYSANEYDDKTLAYNSISYIVEDHLFRLWVGTFGGGLSLYDRKTDSYSTYNRKSHGLPGDFINGIVESRFGNLWIATNAGLSRFDFDNKEFYNYERQSGFPLSELNNKAILLTRSGELFLGGVDGLISFHEEDILYPEVDCNMVFSDILVNNKPISSGFENGILDAHVSQASTLTLKPEHSVFKILYSSCNYNESIKNKYQYQLEGFDNDWIDAEYVTSATYTNLNPGNYTFKVRATDVSYNPITEAKTISILVKPPWSKSTIAYGFYIFIVVGLVGMFNYFYMIRIRLNYQLENAKVDKKRSAEFNNAKLQFFTNISHEFMTPLTIIISSLEYVSANYKIASKQSKHLNLAFRNAKRLKHLNGELLDFRKFEQGKVKLKIQKIDVVSYLAELTEEFFGMAKMKEIQCDFDKPDHTHFLYLDPVQIDKVFYNLLSNAINHVDNKTGKVLVSLNIESEYTQLIVSDNGNGIPDEYVDKIFDRFFQTNNSTNNNREDYNGSGIGLALSKSIVVTHGGTIECKSIENEGTTFIVALKHGTDHFDNYILKTDDDYAKLRIDKDVAILPGFESDGLKSKHEGSTDKSDPLILVVDDNPEIHQVIRVLFEDTCRMEFATDGVDGFEKALNKQPHLIISDVRMPRLNGFELCDMLKRNVNVSHIPVILLTALNDEEYRTQGFKNGADAYLTKPFNSETLKARVESLFKSRSVLQEKFSKDTTGNSQSITQNLVDRKFIDKAMSVIGKNITNTDFKVDEFASEMQMGRTLFYNKVKTITGQTPNEFILSERLKRASEMLLNETHKNVSEIAYDTGFNSPRYFSMCFKNHFGVTPSKYVQSKINRS